VGFRHFPSEASVLLPSLEDVRQRAEVLIELLRTKTLLAMSSEYRLDRGVPPFDRLKRSQGGIHPILWQMIENRARPLTGS
jgi:hypothetical protein